MDTITLKAVNLPHRHTQKPRAPRTSQPATLTMGHPVLEPGCLRKEDKASWLKLGHGMEGVVKSDDDFPVSSFLSPALSNTAGCREI